MAKPKRVLFRRSPFLVSYWDADKLVFENYATGKGATAAPIATEVLNFFSHWRSAEALFRHFPQYSAPSLRTALKELTRHSLLNVPTASHILSNNRWERGKIGIPLRVSFTSRDVIFRLKLTWWA